MKHILLIIIAASWLAIPAAAQRKFYKADPAAAAQIARALAAPAEKAEQRMVRENTVNEAFAELFKVSAVKERDVEKLLALLAERRQLLDSLHRIENTAAERRAAITAPADSHATDPELTQAHNDIAHLMARIDKARVELKQAEAKMAADSVNLAIAIAEAGAAGAELDSIRRIADADMANADVARSMRGEAAVEDVVEAMRIPSGRLQLFDIERYNSAVSALNDAAPQLEGNERAARVIDSVAAFNRDILPAARAIIGAVEVMAGKYDEATASRVAGETAALNSSAARSAALKPYRSEITEVAAAAADFNRAYRNLTFLLSELQGMGGNVEADFDINDFIRSVVGIYATGTDRYSAYYVTFNKALDTLGSTFRPGISASHAAEIVSNVTSSIRK